ncbi:MAG: PTS sugar transporter subunit IIC [Erysipelotrichia bacterium]|nr:PTS sugar transporter subunit IIC [Erysipelotrichia bacterium]NCC55415.1 PTS sugar transporter subunit IIC [Erysipelotrichia bacterium]
MKKFTAWMEEHFVPVAAKIGSQKHLVAIRDAFISIMPITMAGAFATLLNVFVRDLPNSYLPDLKIAETMEWLITINGNVWWGTLAMLSIAFVFALGYQLSKAYKTNALAGGLVAFASFIAVTPQVATIAGAGAKGADVVGWGFLNWAYLDAKGLFTALFIGFLSTIVYAKLMNKNVTIKLPDSVPPAVSKAFASIIPGVIAIYLCGTLAWLVATFADGMAIGDLILKYVQMPFLGLSQGLGAVLVVVIAVQLFWFFGLHGTNVLGAVLDGTYLTATTMNDSAYNAGKAMEFIWTRGSFDAYVWMGGTGCTLALIIAVLIFSKRADSKAVAKLSAPMGAFNINEPVVFGMPIVLNPIYFIPWLLVPIVLTLIAYGATAAGFVPYVHVVVPWVVPPVIYAWLATGGSFAAALLALVNLIIGVAIWSVFVMMANRIDIKEDEVEA